ncbi:MULTISPECIES: ribosome biogenesis GTPase Der [unclassified Francisella]|uniref:ribosome biogenesis GTPase Der n=1 Tax=unclassified Francisella TaxID=2610885 RepID=UPI002E337F70|nr:MULTISPECIES: ribosome biogenesis GTPase Der [unclassified Francisella]MED7820106.1 ribosome biogenesis GTPase Der [Francisella sp. 19S2-4]MED7830926.1 ribosome biogenesis GTPase Der [Francisella sp. 19S2-10]
MSFLVAIVGRANVGKSTLFNVLTNSRDALVFDFEGVTRDRQYGQAKYDELDYLVVDTGGISDRDVGFDEFMAKQSEMAIEEANLVFFVVDGRSGLTAGDEYVANLLRQRDKKVIVVVNKVDGVDEESAMAEFYSFGFDKVFAISAAHRRNTQKLVDKFLKKPLNDYYQDYTQTGEHKEQLRHGIHFSLIGRPNVGKSTLTNRMLGEDRVVVFDMPGTTIDSVSIPFERHGQKYTIVDTAGVRKRGRVKETLEKFSVVKTLQAIQDSNVVVAVVDARTGISDQDLSLIHFAIKNGRALVLAVNKWDGMTEEARNKVKEDIKRRLYFLQDYVDIHFISALHGTNVGHVFESIQTAYECANRKITTADATKLLQLAIEAHSPPMVGKFRIKLKYAHVGGHNPPVIVIHGNQVGKLPHSYKRYLENFFREALDFRGTPIVFEFKQSENPFATKKNKRSKDESNKSKKVK